MPSFEAMYLDDDPGDLDDADVLADQLQAVGDVRGELLALEVASVRMTCADEARRINREATRLRNAEGTRLWPRARTSTPAFAPV